MAAPYVVFLAEDNPGDIALLKLALKQHCVDCVLNTYRDGDSALSAIDRAEGSLPEERPALFIIDLNLGRVHGIVLLKRLKESLVLGSTPVVVWTTSDSPKDRERSEQYGAHSHIRKPAQLEGFIKLGAMIGEILTAQA